MTQSLEGCWKFTGNIKRLLISQVSKNHSIYTRNGLPLPPGLQPIEITITINGNTVNKKKENGCRYARPSVE
jgi:hypothetical protein